MDGENSLPKEINVVVESFFSNLEIDECYHTIDVWRELALSETCWSEHISPSDIIMLHDKLIELIASCYRLNFKNFDTAPKARSANSLAGSPQRIRFLSRLEAQEPLLVLSELTHQHDLKFYQDTFRNLLMRSLSKNADTNFQNSLNVFGFMKRLVEACWIIRCRRAAGNGFSQDFLYTDPTLLGYDDLNRPFDVLEEFFSGASLGAYRMELKDWFNAALTTGKQLKKPADFLYFYKQITGVIQAVYLILKDQLIYDPRRKYTESGETFVEWINRIRMRRIDLGEEVHWEYEVYALAPEMQNDVHGYLRQSLTIPRISEIRYGLQCWLSAALSTNQSISTLEDQYVFPLYEEMEKLIEASYLLIIAQDQ